MNIASLVAEPPREGMRSPKNISSMMAGHPWDCATGCAAAMPGRAPIPDPTPMSEAAPTAEAAPMTEAGGDVGPSIGVPL
eukprot:163708-Chlamydomonas_euryale.AAC.2